MALRAPEASLAALRHLADQGEAVLGGASPQTGAHLPFQGPVFLSRSLGLARLTAKIVPESSPNHLTIAPKSFLNGPNIIQTSSQNHAIMVRTSSTSYRSKPSKPSKRFEITGPGMTVGPQLE